MTVDALNELKLKTITDFESYLNRLYKGYKDSDSHLFDLIYYIENYKIINNPQTTLEKLLIWK